MKSFILKVILKTKAPPWETGDVVGKAQMWGTVDDEQLYPMTQLISVNNWTDVREVRLFQRPHNQAITGSLSLSSIKGFLKCTKA